MIKVSALLKKEKKYKIAKIGKVRQITKKGKKYYITLYITAVAIYIEKSIDFGQIVRFLSFLFDIIL